MRMDFDILKTVVVSRQSIREFSNKQIAPGVLETILGYSLVCVLVEYDL